MAVTQEDVRRCYRILLGREPENRDVVEQKVRAHRDLWQLIEEFTSSPEFRNRRGLAITPLRVDVPAETIDVDVSSDDLTALREHVQASWEQLGRDKAHYSVLTRQEYLPAAFADNETAFWSSGEDQVAWLVRILERHGMTALQSKSCIDFGCGVGRLTEPLARTFRQVHGYDISEPHLVHARSRVAQHQNVDFSLVRTLPVPFAPADVFFSLIVLQHNPPPIIALIIRGALQGLRPGGLAVFQVPTYALGYSFSMADYARHIRRSKRDIEMHCIPQQDVYRIAAETGCRVVEIREQDMTGRLGSDVSNVFVIQRPG
jgi:2-polyprenyl-3-methyl-5-hydroxy-6-metoxy-1,4-benzoquinol methylase